MYVDFNICMYVWIFCMDFLLLSKVVFTFTNILANIFMNACNMYVCMYVCMYVSGCGYVCMYY